MSRGRSFARGPSAYRRSTPRFRPSGKSFLIVTEGEKTEPNYLVALRNRLQLNAAEVEILHPDGTDPVTLTKLWRSSLLAGLFSKMIPRDSRVAPS